MITRRETKLSYSNILIIAHIKQNKTKKIKVDTRKEKNAKTIFKII